LPDPSPLAIEAVWGNDPINSRIYMKPLLAFLILSSLCHAADPHLPAGTKALPSAAPKGRGPPALVNLNHHVLGHAMVFGGKEPDFFVAGMGAASGAFVQVGR
jgi:hypothetical protein